MKLVNVQKNHKKITFYGFIALTTLIAHDILCYKV